MVAPTKHTDRFEWLIEKATELGVKEILPVWTRRSERRTDKHALVQSGRGRDQAMPKAMDAGVA